jgi:hypothetical protein
MPWVRVGLTQAQHSMRTIYARYRGLDARKWVQSDAGRRIPRLITFWGSIQVHLLPAGPYLSLLHKPTEAYPAPAVRW